MNPTRALLQALFCLRRTPTTGSQADKGGEKSNNVSAPGKATGAVKPTRAHPGKQQQLATKINHPELHLT